MAAMPSDLRRVMSSVVRMLGPACTVFCVGDHPGQQQECMLTILASVAPEHLCDVEPDDMLRHRAGRQEGKHTQKKNHHNAMKLERP